MAELGEIFALASVGSVINDRIIKPDIKNQNNKSKKEKSNTRDIYTTNNERNVRDAYEKLARDRSRAGRDFKNTKVIPKRYKQIDDYNQRNRGKINLNEHFANSSNQANQDDDSQFSDNQTFDDNLSRKSTGSDDGYHGINLTNPHSVMEKMANLTNNRRYESKIARQNNHEDGATKIDSCVGDIENSSGRNKFNETNTWIHQYDQMAFNNLDQPSAMNGSNKKNVGKHSAMARIELERQMEIDGGYSAYQHNDDGTYGVVRAGSSDFIHENMVPFVRKGPNEIEESKKAMVGQMKVELFTGSADNPDWRPRIERAPLFSPLVGAKNLDGDPVRTDEYKSRYIVENKRNNELPFQQVKVTPGLDIGYSAVGKHGYHDMYQHIPREAYVDQLRTLNKPKISYGSYVGPGQKGEKGGVIGTVSQYKAPRYRERGTKDMVRGRAYITAPTVYGEYDPKNLATVNRGTKETMKIGPAKHYLEGNTPGKYRGNYREANRENYKYDDPRNVILYESLAGKGHNNQSFVPDATKRELKSQHGHAHNNETNKSYAVDYDGATPHVTMREIHQKNDRAGHIGNAEVHKEVAINWNDIPDVTKRNQHNQYDRTGHVVGEKNQYQAVNYADLPDPTKRDQHQHYDRAGNVAGEKNQYTAINYEDLPDPTKRDQHKHYDRAGHVVGEKSQYQAINWNDVSDPTKRNQHAHYDRAGNLTGEKNQYTSINYDDLPDPTKRNQHQHYDRAGNLVGEKNQYTAINYDDLPDPTKRNQHQHYDRAGNLVGEKNQYTAINYDDLPDPTKRNQHQHYDRAGNLVGEKNQYTAINYDDLPDPTKRNQHEKYDRAGHLTGNREQYQAVNYDDLPDPTKRNQHEKYDRAGHLTGNREQHKAVNYDDVPDPTKRNQHERYDRAGNLTGNKEQHKAVNYDDVPDPTKRNQHERYDRAGHIVGNREQYQAVNYDDVPDSTKRNHHEHYDRAGHMTGNKEQHKAVNWNDIPDVTKREINPGGRSANIAGNKEQHIAVNWNDVPDATKRTINPGGRSANVTGNKEWHRSVNWDDVPDPTKREQHPGGRMGGGDSQDRRQGSRHQYMVMQVNGAKEALNVGRSPTKVGMDKGWTIDHTAFYLKDPVESTWKASPSSDIMRTNDQLGIENTKVPTGRFWINDRILAHTDENLEGNPFVNNLIHRAI
jgi:hypothetical protein